MNEKRTKLGGPPTLGLLVDWLEDSYQATVLRGAFDAARARGAKLLCFAGGVLDAPYRGGVLRNHVYDLATPQSVDGLIVLSGTIGNYAGEAQLERFVNRFKPLPICSIALEISGLASVLVDNDTGMRKAITHLIRVHGCQHIAFIRGPEANAEAERRFSVYRTVLAEHDLRYDERLVAGGDFQSQSGREAVRSFFEERHLKPATEVDAIVAANDSMALGALCELDDLRIRVPEQLALVGFDDVEDIRYVSPPLTSVRQPLYEQGKEAVRVVLAAVQGRNDEAQVVLHTNLVTRRSCRCHEQTSRGASSPLAPTTRSSFEAAVVERRQVILAELARAARGSFVAAGAGWELRLLNAFMSQLRKEAPEPFIAAFDDVLQRVQQAGGDVSVCHDVISAFRRQMLACLATDLERRQLAEDMFQDVRLMTGDTLVRGQARERMRVERWARSLSDTGASLIATFDLEHLGAAVVRGFPQLGIGSCALVLYEPGDQQRGRVCFAYDGEKLMDLPAHRRVFAVRDVIPHDLKLKNEHASFVVLPLFFKTERLGYVLVQLGLQEVFAYEALRELFSSAVKGALLVREVTEVGEEHTLTLDALASHQAELADAERLLSELHAELSDPEQASKLAQARAVVSSEIAHLRDLSSKS